MINSEYGDKPLNIYLFNENGDKVVLTKIGDYKLTAIETVTYEGNTTTTKVNHNYKELKDVVNHYSKFGFTVGAK